MTAHRRLAVVPAVVDEPDPELVLAEVAYDLGAQQGRTETVPFAEAFERGRAFERNVKANGFADGMRLGISLAVRLAAGDTALAAQIGRLVDGC